MAGKKTRKRRKSHGKNSKGKELDATGKEESTHVEMKKVKLSSELEQGSQPSTDKQELKLDKGDSSNAGVVDLQLDYEETDKYVPPFSRSRAKRSLNRNGKTASPSARPKRSWRGTKRNSLGESLSQYDDKNSVENSDNISDRQDALKMEKEDEKEDVEKEIDVVGMEEDVFCSQDIETSPLNSAHEIREENGTSTKENTPVTVSPVTITDKIIDTTLGQLLNDIIDTACKLYQSTQNKAGIDERNGDSELPTQGLHSLETDVSECDKEDLDLAVPEDPGDCGEPVMETVCSHNGAATESDVIESLEECVDNNMCVLAKRNSLQSSPLAGEKIPEVSKLEECVGKCGEDHFNLVEAERQSENEIDKDQRMANWNVTESSELQCAHGRKNEGQNLDTENFAFASTVGEEIPPITKAMIGPTSVDTVLDPGVPDHAIDQKSQQNTCQQGKNDSTVQIAQQTSEKTESGTEEKMDALLPKQVSGFDVATGFSQLNKEQSRSNSKELANLTAGQTQLVTNKTTEAVGHELLGCDIGDDDIVGSSHLNRHEGLDQMVPRTEEVITALLQAQCDGKELKLPACSGQYSTHESEEVEIDKITCKEQSLQERTTFSIEMMTSNAPDSQTQLNELKYSSPLSTEPVEQLPSFNNDADILELDCMMDCTDSQLVCLDSSAEQSPHQNFDTLSDNAKGSTRQEECQCDMEVPSDNGMIKGLISELSSLNKFIMGVWKDVEMQRKKRQAKKMFKGRAFIK